MRTSEPYGDGTRAERREARRMAVASYREFGPYVCNWGLPRYYLIGRGASLRWRFIGYAIALIALFGGRS